VVNILYCFDNNYNLQAYTSIVSLLDYAKSKVNINIIHRQGILLEDIPKVITNHKNLSSIKLNKFNIDKANFPNIENAHVSEATYYRIYLDNFLDKSVDDILYVDADIVFLNDITKVIKDLTSKLRSSDYLIAASTEYLNTTSNNQRFNSLNMQSSRYLNAGVMLIDVVKWREQDVGNTLLDVQKRMASKLIYWDQDVFNIYLDGNYMELSEKLNYNPSNIIGSKENIQNIYENIICIHYNGKSKPWTVKGILKEDSIFFQHEYRKLKINSFLITHVWKWNSLKYFIFSFFNLKILKVQKKSKFIIDFFKSILT
jgi:lipopolysaccharide biosynthesis glycosyltransferase